MRTKQKLQDVLQIHNLRKRAVTKSNCELSGIFQSYYKEYQDPKKDEEDGYFHLY